jgi:hypothetical protein
VKRGGQGLESRFLLFPRVFAQPDPSKVREFADDVRDGKFFCLLVAACRCVMRLKHMC